MARADAYNKVAVTALKIERYRRGHGRLPDRLEDLLPELLPEVPRDTCADGPLRYRLRAGGCRVYSVGQDGQDHGGQPLIDGVPYGQTDLVIEVPARSASGSLPP